MLPPTSERVGPCSGGLHTDQVARIRRRPCALSSRRRAISPVALQPSSSSMQLPAAQQQKALLFRAVELLFKFPPFFAFAAAQARSKISQRGKDIGLDFDGEVAALSNEANWDAELAIVQDQSLQYPAYYVQPFHAYPQGNLNWDAALQVNAAAKSVHAPVMDPAGRALSPDGDAQLRGSYSAHMAALMQRAGSRPVRQALDLGCATALSTLELWRAFPEASIAAIDLSPHFLAVARHLQRRRQAAPGAAEEPIRFSHAAAERTGLGDASTDLVSCCLVMHELPQSAAKAVIAEAYRVLRPGGTLAIMEMDPASEGFQRIFANPMAFAAFKSTEPWLLEYVALDLPAVLQDAGFRSMSRSSSTPRHFTLIAVKP